MKKVAIVTILDNNLGNRLQNYALQEILKKLGCSVETIQKDKKNTDASRLVKFVVKKLLNKKDWKFREFDRRINWSPYTLSISEDKSKMAKRYDMFVAGSDQVWNPFFGGTDDSFLAFAPKEKRISYAASFGVSELPDHVIEKFGTHLSDFASISVREKQAVEIVEQFEGCHAELVLDPTLLLSKDDWMKIAKIPKINGKYVVKYLLGEEQAVCDKLIDELASNTAVIDIKSLLAGQGDTIGPAEFIGLVMNAELICTDSFHATVFSTIFEKPFVIFERADKEKDMSSRLDSLCQLLDLNNHRYSSSSFNTASVMMPYYQNTSSRIECELQKSITYLKKALKI